ncbi:cupin domain-containing protein [Robertkochia solimangrovi]|uniref:cupin domain-containing protein n=1 Tax=Robertkochia solimangrovi TaxID=2213046 RepID=UPI00117DC70B|nr:cupin domain-containing protein [Robertkochia solimangrovi]TRZ42031.1 cupin [Robertkochia solimangrovi]
MDKKYVIQSNPFKVPTTDGKTILEHFGLASTGDSGYSIAHMIAPPDWSEPFQTPEFEEITFVIKGRKQFTIENKRFVLGPGESIRISGNTRIQYANPFEEPCEYLSICIPAFSPETVHRETD